VAASLRDQVREQTTTALKAGDSVRVGTLRLLTAAITNREKEVGHELDDDEVREVAAKEVKKRTEAIEAFAGAGRDELVEKESAEREILRPYAPAQLDDAAVAAIVDEVIAATGASGPGDLGKVMGQAMGRLKGQADGSAVQALVRERLGA
jgi:uncharacterized protein YqeY